MILKHKGYYCQTVPETFYNDIRINVYVNNEHINSFIAFSNYRKELENKYDSLTKDRFIIWLKMKN